jgi:hypothetical protein
VDVSAALAEVSHSIGVALRGLPQFEFTARRIERRGVCWHGQGNDIAGRQFDGLRVSGRSEVSVQGYEREEWTG